jgi:hypothetical protein
MYFGKRIFINRSDNFIAFLIFYARHLGVKITGPCRIRKRVVNSDPDSFMSQQFFARGAKIPYKACSFSLSPSKALGSSGEHPFRVWFGLVEQILWNNGCSINNFSGTLLIKQMCFLPFAIRRNVVAMGTLCVYLSTVHTYNVFIFYKRISFCEAK